MEYRKSYLGKKEDGILKVEEKHYDDLVLKIKNQEKEIEKLKKTQIKFITPKSKQRN